MNILLKILIPLLLLILSGCVHHPRPPSVYTEGYYSDRTYVPYYSRGSSYYRHDVYAEPYIYNRQHDSHRGYDRRYNYPPKKHKRPYTKYREDRYLGKQHKQPQRTVFRNNARGTLQEPNRSNRYQQQPNKHKRAVIEKPRQRTNRYTTTDTFNNRSSSPTSSYKSHKSHKRSTISAPPSPSNNRESKRSRVFSTPQQPSSSGSGQQRSYGNTSAPPQRQRSHSGKSHKR